MPLATDVQNRVSTQLLVELTNPGSSVPSASTVDTARLALAVADAQAEFRTRVGLAFDDTDARHVDAGIQGVLVKLEDYAGRSTEDAQRRRQRWADLLSALARSVGSRRRISPVSSGTLLPSTEAAQALPDFDRSRWRGLTPNMPGGGDATDDARGG